MATTKKTEEVTEEITEVIEEPEKMVTLTIESNREDDGPVFVAVNDRTYLIQRDVEVTVPVSVYKIVRQSQRQMRVINKARKAREVK